MPWFQWHKRILTEPDALDRSITIEQDRIENENRRQEEEIVAKFLEIRPKLLANIFDTLVKTLQIKPSVELNATSEDGRLCYLG